MRQPLVGIAVVVSVLLCSICQIRAQESAPPNNTARNSREEKKPLHDEPAAQRPALKLGAYAETYYSWNFNRPSNGITNYRGFDNRHNTFTLANVALDAQWDYANVIGRITLQVGHTPSTYYASEPSEMGSAGADATGPNLWKYLQQAYLGYRFKDVLTLSAGLFLSPIGPESMVTHQNWNWSRSNLFFGCPFYHTGARAKYALGQHWAFTLAAYNGWNSVVDNNSKKSISPQVTYDSDKLSASVLYFGGSERPTGAPEGQAWRNLFDAHATWHVNSWFSLLAHSDAGFEHNNFGASRWAAGALYTRFQLRDWMYLAARGDFFRQHNAHNAQGTASSIFWPVSWVSSATATLDLRPNDSLAVMVEYRHNQAHGDMFYGGQVATDHGAFVANRKQQNTITIGATAWY